MAQTNKQRFAQTVTGGAGSLTLPKFPKLTLPDKIVRAFPELQLHVDRHDREVEAWVKQAVEGIRSAIPTN